jgi:hypothetical protein
MILQLLGVPWLLDQLNSNNDDQVSAAQYCVQTVINTISGLDLKDDKQPNKELCEGIFVFRLFVCFFVFNLIFRKCSAPQGN